MRFNIPPLVTYVFGAFLIVFGVLRMKYLAAPRPPQSDEDEAEAGRAAAEVKPVRGKVQQRHLRWGAIYVLLGAFLIVSTYFQMRRQ